MNLVSRFLVLAAAIPAYALAQQPPTPLPTDTLPPARINVPPAPPPPTVPVALRQQIDAAIQAWKTESNGKAFFPGLTYVNAKPALMLVTSDAESEATKLNRKRAILTACDFLIDPGAFDEATICVLSADPHGKRPTSTKNTKVTRTQLEQTFVQSGKASNAKDGIKKAKTDDALVRDVCATLGID